MGKRLACLALACLMLLACGGCGVPLVYGMTPSTETFLDDDGSIGGYPALFCAWLSDLLHLSIRPEIMEIDELFERLADGTVALTGDLTSTPARLERYAMTGPIAERSVKIFRLKNAESLNEITSGREPRFTFLDQTTTAALVEAAAEYTFATSYVSNFDEAAQALLEGEADAFMIDGTAEAAFESYDNIVAEEFFPLIYTPVSLSTQTPALQPVISVVQKYLDSGAIYHLMELYSRGSAEYLRHKLYIRLTPEEKQYIAGHLAADEPVLVAAETDNYPASFYNEQEDEFQVIAHDVLSEISALTGLSFQPVNGPEDEWYVVFAMLEDGEAAMITELIYSKDRASRFLWADDAYSSDKYALLSTAEHDDITVNQVLYSRVGLIYESAYAEIFQE